MQYTKRTSFEVNGITYKLMTEHYQQITKTQLQCIREYDALQKANGNTDRSRANRVQFLFLFAREIGKPFNQVTEKDILVFLGRKLKPNTRNSYVEQVKHFFKWMDKEDIVKNLKQSQCDDFIDSKDLLTDSEIYAMIEAATHPRDKCLVSLLFDLAIERKTIALLNIEDIEINDDRVYVTVQGKKRGNRGRRKLQCITSAPYVIDWLNNHPNKNQPQAPFFISLSCNSYGSRVSYGYAYEQVKLLAKRAGIKKPVWTHLIRHSKITDLYKKGFRGVPLQRFTGWVNGNMEQRYVNLAPEEMDNMRISAEQGTVFEPVKPEPSKVISIVCPRCKHLNPSTAEYCTQCWFPLKREVAVKEQDEMEFIRLQLYKAHEQKMLERENVEAQKQWEREQQEL